jgi:hypothetical protein
LRDDHRRVGGAVTVGLWERHKAGWHRVAVEREIY